MASLRQNTGTVEQNNDKGPITQAAAFVGECPGYCLWTSGTAAIGGNWRT